MLNPLINNVALSVFFWELIKRELTAWILRTINASTREQACQFGNCNSEKLLRIDVFKPFFEIWHLGLQSFDEAFCYFAEKDAALTGRIKKGGVRILEEFLRQHIQHLVSKLWRSEDLVVAEVCYARQDIRIVDVLK